MALPIRVEISDGGVTAAFNALIKAGEEPAPLLDALGRQLKTNIQLGFVTGTGPYGRKWAPLKIRPGQPLQDKGHLVNSIDYRVQGNSVDVGTNREHMHIHQLGATIKAKPGKRLVFMGADGKLIFAKQVKVPARPFLPMEGLPDPWREDLADVTGDYLKSLLGI